MKNILLALTMVWASVTAVFADEAEIQAVISNQIEAFKADEFDKAFAIASPKIQAIFGTPNRFGQMVSQGYPMVHRPDNVQFLELREIAGNLYQQVQIRDGNGVFYTLDYNVIMIKDEWRIDGVQLLPTQEFGA